MSKFGELFTRGPKQGYKHRKINGEPSIVLELIKEDRLEKYKSFLDNNRKISDFNDYFHRYENKFTFTNIIYELYGQR